LQQPHLDGGVLSWSAPLPFKPITQNPIITPPVRGSADDIDEEIKPQYKSSGSIAPTSSAEKLNFSTIGSLSSKKMKKYFY